MAHASRLFFVGSGDYNSRGRGLNNFLYWLAQIFGSFAIGTFLDSSRMTRTSRAWGGWIICFCFTFAVWSGNYVNQKGCESCFSSLTLIPNEMHDRG